MVAFLIRIYQQTYHEYSSMNDVFPNLKNSTRLSTNKSQTYIH